VPWIGPLWNEAWHHNLPLLACNLAFVLGLGGWLDLLADTRWTVAVRAAISEWVNENVTADATLMANEFGTLGYITHRHMIDTVGLINWTNDYPERRARDQLAALVKHYRPGLVLVDTGLLALHLERETG
jgi:hypothetical protein